MDNLTKEQRKKNMRAICSKDTKIEIRLRRELWRRGFRYRIHYKQLAGKPDIVFVRQKIAIFCDSEFFHGFNWEEQRKRIKSNRKYWISKIENNIDKDKIVNELLKKEGWIVLRFWGKEIHNNLFECADIIEHLILERT